jgi:hypothetical protein
MVLSRRTPTVLALSLILTLAACGGKPAELPVVTPSVAPFDHKARLTASTSGIDQGTYEYFVTLPDDARTHGVLNRASRSADFEMTLTPGRAFEGTLQVRNVGADRYIRSEFSKAEIARQLAGFKTMLEQQGLDRTERGRAMMKVTQKRFEQINGKLWMRFDPKVFGTGDLQVDLTDPDLIGIKRLLAGAVDVHGDARRMTGTLDATAIGTEEPLIGPTAAKRLPPKAGSVPFETWFDDQGRLTMLALQAMPAVGKTPAGKWKFTFSAYGTAAAQPAPPPALVRDAGQDLASLFQG